MRERGRWEGAEYAAPRLVAQATLRLRSELECERVIRLAHRESVASATAYRGPEGEASPIFVMVIDEAGVMGRFLPTLQTAVPEASISITREEVLHAAPHDFLRRGALEPKPFRAEAGQLGWIFAGGTLGAGARILVEAGARYAGFEAFP